MWLELYWRRVLTGGARCGALSLVGAVELWLSHMIVGISVSLGRAIYMHLTTVADTRGEGDETPLVVMAVRTMRLIDG